MLIKWSHHVLAIRNGTRRDLVARQYNLNDITMGCSFWITQLSRMLVVMVGGVNCLCNISPWAMKEWKIYQFSIMKMLKNTAAFFPQVFSTSELNAWDDFPDHTLYNFFYLKLQNPDPRLFSSDFLNFRSTHSHTSEGIFWS